MRVEPGDYSQGKAARATARVFEFNAQKKAYEPRVTFKLENEVLPGKVHITEDGSRIVAVDDWYARNYEKPVVVIYDGAGKVIKQFRVSELLSREEIDELKPRPGRIDWSAWKIDTNLAIHSNELFVLRDRIAQGAGKKFENFFIDLKTFKIKKEVLE